MGTVNFKETGGAQLLRTQIIARNRNKKTLTKKLAAYVLLSLEMLTKTIVCIDICQVNASLRFPVYLSCF